MNLFYLISPMLTYQPQISDYLWLHFRITRAVFFFLNIDAPGAPLTKIYLNRSRVRVIVKSFSNHSNAQPEFRIIRVEWGQIQLTVCFCKQNLLIKKKKRTYWNITMLIHLCIVSGCFYIVAEDLSSCVEITRDTQCQKYLQSGLYRDGSLIPSLN